MFGSSDFYLFYPKLYSMMENSSERPSEFKNTRIKTKNENSGFVTAAIIVVLGILFVIGEFKKDSKPTPEQSTYTPAPNNYNGTNNYTNRSYSNTHSYSSNSYRRSYSSRSYRRSYSSSRSYSSGRSYRSRCRTRSFGSHSFRRRH